MFVGAGQEEMDLTQSGQAHSSQMWPALHRSPFSRETRSLPIGVTHQPPPNYYPDCYGQDFIYQDYGPHWPVPTLAECIAHHVPFDFVKYMGNSEVLPVFGGDVTLYPGWRSTFFNYVHVQNVPVMFKCHALDKSVKDDIKERLFYGLDFSSTGYKLRLHRLESEFGGLDLLIRSFMGKLRVLKDVTKDEHHLQRAVFVLQQVISSPQLSVGTIEVAALVLPYLPIKVRKAFSYYCLTFQPTPLREDLFSLHKYLQLKSTIHQKASFELKPESTWGSPGIYPTCEPTASLKIPATERGAAIRRTTGMATFISSGRTGSPGPFTKGGPVGQEGEDKN